MTGNALAYIASRTMKLLRIEFHQKYVMTHVARPCFVSFCASVQVECDGTTKSGFNLDFCIKTIFSALTHLSYLAVQY